MHFDLAFLVRSDKRNGLKWVPLDVHCDKVESEWTYADCSTSRSINSWGKWRRSCWSSLRNRWDKYFTIWPNSWLDLKRRRSDCRITCRSWKHRFICRRGWSYTYSWRQHARIRSRWYSTRWSTGSSNWHCGRSCGWSNCRWQRWGRDCNRSSRR